MRWMHSRYITTTFFFHSFTKSDLPAFISYNHKHRAIVQLRKYFVIYCFVALRAFISGKSDCHVVACIWILILHSIWRIMLGSCLHVFHSLDSNSLQNQSVFMKCVLYDFLFPWVPFHCVWKHSGCTIILQLVLKSSDNILKLYFVMNEVFKSRRIWVTSQYFCWSRCSIEFVKKVNILNVCIFAIGLAL